MDATTRQACFDAARTHAYDRYVAALLSPAGVRDDLVVWAGVVGEIERIPFLVSEPMLGEIRLQWWRDWLDGLGPVGDNPQTHTQSGNPLADAMADAIERHQLPRQLIFALLEARISDLYADPFDNVAEFDAYLCATEGAAFDIACRIAAQGIQTPSADVVKAAAVTYGTARVLSKLGMFAGRGRWALPNNFAGEEARFLDTDTLDPDGAELRARSLSAGCAHARRAFAEVRGLLASVDKAVRCALLPVALVEPYLQRLERIEGDIFHAGITQVTPLTRVWRLWLAARWGRL